MTNSEILKSNGFKKIPETDISTITLPGAMKAFESLHENFGNVRFKRNYVNQQFIMLKSGVIVSPRVAFDWQNSLSNLKGNGLKILYKKWKCI